jgi:hypothetical protein
LQHVSRANWGCTWSPRFLTNKGIDYLREYLNLPAEIVPATLKKSTRPLERTPPMRGDRPPRREVSQSAPMCSAD